MENFFDSKKNIILAGVVLIMTLSLSGLFSQEEKAVIKDNAIDIKKDKKDTVDTGRKIAEKKEADKKAPDKKDPAKDDPLNKAAKDNVKKDEPLNKDVINNAAMKDAARETTKKEETRKEDPDKKSGSEEIKKEASKNNGVLKEVGKKEVIIEKEALKEKGKTGDIVKEEKTEKSGEINLDEPVKGKKKDASAAKKKKYFTLNFKDVELSEFLNIMSQLIGKNVIIDEKIRGKITISSSKKIPVDQAYEILKTILEVKGLAVIETENLIKVLPIKEAIRKNVEIIIDGKKKMIPVEENIVTYLFEIEFADANEIAQVLRSLKSEFTDVVVYAPQNTIILTGNSTEINGLIKIARALDRKIEEIKAEKAPKGNIHVVHLENADAEQLANVLSRIPFSEKALIDTTPLPSNAPVEKSDKGRRIAKQQQAVPAKDSKMKLSIVASKETNSLIISATPDEYREISRIINELDIVRDQVYIEALIVEVSAESGWGLGIDWMLGNQSGTHLYGGSSIMGNVPNYTTPSGLAGKKLFVPLASGLQLGYLSDRSVLGFALLNASGTDKNFNILSTPQLLATDNQEAELNVGEEIPVPTNNRISDTGTQFYTFEYKSVGVKLKITPHITNKQAITIDLYQEVNSVLGESTVLTSGSVIPPKLGKRDIKTKITIGDGKTIVVGGLIKNTRNQEETKVPILGDIPLLGWFFKHKTSSVSKTNLLVFITPYIVTKHDRQDAITEQKKEEQRRLKLR